MPQMMPINWIIMLVFFSISLFMFSMMNYYSSSYKNNYSMKIEKKSKINWKW